MNNCEHTLYRKEFHFIFYIVEQQNQIRMCNYNYLFIIILIHNYGNSENNSILITYITFISNIILGKQLKNSNQHY
ncbi:hypothetical protein DERP_008278 [Dermatophagoides pteronyssinus]|uniref:Uncharacterized protein n=1 Tax=Dermatophagoides pteronyssinus TaxID=6956 RepID=A0ABQ8J664_DERPT|nr:hypothetical protein DERP_008278 [Dermatophagoides pteronyssinus]